MNSSFKRYSIPFLLLVSGVFMLISCLFPWVSLESYTETSTGKTILIDLKFTRDKVSGTLVDRQSKIVREDQILDIYYSDVEGLANEGFDKEGKITSILTMLGGAFLCALSIVHALPWETHRLFRPVCLTSLILCFIYSLAPIILLIKFFIKVTDFELYEKHISDPKLGIRADINELKGNATIVANIGSILATISEGLVFLTIILLFELKLTSSPVKPKTSSSII